MAAANAPIIMREALTVRNSISAFTSFIFFHPFSLASTGVWGELFDSRRTAFFCALSAGSFDNSAVSYAWCCFLFVFVFSPDFWMKLLGVHLHLTSGRKHQ